MTNTTQHTPEPWTVDTCDWPIIVNEGDTVVALIPQPIITAVGSDADAATEAAEYRAHENARLIAKAPEMRSLIGWMLTALEDCEAGECDEARAARALLAEIDGGSR